MCRLRIRYGDGDDVDGRVVVGGGVADMNVDGSGGGVVGKVINRAGVATCDYVGGDGSGVGAVHYIYVSVCV